MQHEHSPEPANQPSSRHFSDQNPPTIEHSLLPTTDFDLKLFSQLTQHVMRKEWGRAHDLVISQQAQTHVHSEQIPSREEVTYLCLFTIAHDAPTNLLTSLQTLLPLTEPLKTSPALPLGLRQIMLEPFVGTIRSGTWRTFQQMLAFLENNRSSISDDTMSEILSVRVNRSQLNFASFAFEVTEENRRSVRKMPALLHVVYLANRGIEHWSVPRLIDLGADPTTQFDYAIPTHKDVIKGCTLLHAIMLNADIKTLEKIPDKSTALAIPNDLGDLPIHSLVSTISINSDESSRRVRQLLRKALTTYEEAAPLTGHGKNLADYFLENGKFRAYHELKDLLPEPSTLEPEQSYSGLPGENTAKYTAVELLLNTTRVLSGLPEPLQREAGTLLAHGQNLYDLYLYSEAAVGLATDSKMNGEGLLRLMPRLLWHYPREQTKALMAAYERYHDEVIYEKFRMPGHHANEAEVLLLLNHPGFESLKSENTNFLTSAITSVARFIDQRITLTNVTTLENWRRVGAITHSFKKYKFDSRPIESASLPSLLEEFGFQKIPIRPTDYGDPLQGITALGHGFRLTGMALDGLTRAHQSTDGEYATMFDTGTTLEFRHGYYLVHHEQGGILIVRNSSLVFGRTALKHPAYFMPPEEASGVKHTDLLNLTSDLIEKSMKHIVHADLHEEHVSEVNNFNIAFLLDQLKIVQSEYRHWKFNTDFDSAFTARNGRTRLSDQGAWNAPGFKEIVKRLAVWHRQDNHPSLALAFAHPYLPPWQTHSFIDQYGNKQSSLLITPERLAILQDLMTGQARKNDLIDSGLQSFFQVAGINTHGELYIVDA